MNLLNGFEVFILAIANDYPTMRKRQMRKRGPDPKPDCQRDMRRAMHSKEDDDTLYAYESAREELKRYLGPAELVRDDRGIWNFGPLHTLAARLERRV